MPRRSRWCASRGQVGELFIDQARLLSRKSSEGAGVVRPLRKYPDKWALALGFSMLALQTLQLVRQVFQVTQRVLEKIGNWISVSRDEFTARDRVDHVLGCRL
jgi:hypothetical protein